jgi:hypothetical protein
MEWEIAGRYRRSALDRAKVQRGASDGHSLRRCRFRVSITGL